MSELVDVRVPPMGVFTDATVIGWLRTVGDEVGVGDPLCEVETEKVNTQIASPVAGTIDSILADAGQTLATGSLIARVRTLIDKGK